MYLNIGVLLLLEDIICLYITWMGALRQESRWGRANSWCFPLITGPARQWIAQVVCLDFGEQNCLHGLQCPQGAWSRRITQCRWSSPNTSPVLILKSLLLSPCLTVPLSFVFFAAKQPTFNRTTWANIHWQKQSEEKILFQLHLTMSGETAYFWGQTNPI